MTINGHWIGIRHLVLLTVLTPGHALTGASIDERGNVLLFSSSYQSGGLWMSRAHARED